MEIVWNMQELCQIMNLAKFCLFWELGDLRVSIWPVTHMATFIQMWRPLSLGTFLFSLVLFVFPSASWPFISLVSFSSIYSSPLSVFSLDLLRKEKKEKTHSIGSILKNG